MTSFKYPNLPAYDPNNVVLVSGGFDPLHAGHVTYIQNCAKVGRVWVFLNSDAWLQRKKGKEFLSYEQRQTILYALKNVEHVIAAKDDDNTIVKSLLQIKEQNYPFKFYFGKGGDRNPVTTPEVSVCDSLGIDLLWEMDAGQTQSSSKFLARWRSEEYCDKPVWKGHYDVIRSFSNVKIKELVFGREGKLSLQRHWLRNELWFVLEGWGEIFIGEYPDHGERRILNKHNSITIPCGYWHQLLNSGNKPLKILEIQYGEKCDESDIQRSESSIL